MQGADGRYDGNRYVVMPDVLRCLFCSVDQVFVRFVQLAQTGCSRLICELRGTLMPVPRA